MMQDPHDETVAPWAKDYAKISEEMGDEEFGKGSVAETIVFFVMLVLELGFFLLTAVVWYHCGKAIVE